MELSIQLSILLDNNIKFFTSKSFKNLNQIIENSNKEEIINNNNTINAKQLRNFEDKK